MRMMMVMMITMMMILDQARMLEEYNRKFSSFSNILNEYLRRRGKDEKKRRMRAIFQ